MKNDQQKVLKILDSMAHGEVDCQFIEDIASNYMAGTRAELLSLRDTYEETMKEDNNSLKRAIQDNVVAKVNLIKMLCSEILDSDNIVSHITDVEIAMLNSIMSTTLWLESYWNNKK